MAGDHSYHDTSVIVGDVEKPVVGVGEYEQSPRASEYKDAAWPATCACGYEWPTRPIYSIENVGAHADLIEQVNDSRYYSRSAGPGIPPDEGLERWPYRHGQGMPAGTMIRTWWLEPNHVGPDGMSIGVVLPAPSGMMFPMDYPSSDGGWTRTGVPPKITLSPSINHVDVWHGWLRDGVLTA